MRSGPGNEGGEIQVMRDEHAMVRDGPSLSFDPARD